MKKKDLKEQDFKYLDSKRLKSIENTFNFFGIHYDPNYPGASQFSKNLKKISDLDHSQYQLHTSNSSI